MLFVCAVATIGHVVGTFLVESPPGPDNGFLVAEVTSIGAALATGLLLASGGWAGARLCSDVDSAFATDEEDFDPTEAS